MNIGNTSRLSFKFRQTVNQKSCPQCGARMTEVDRCCENGKVFIWYQCTKNECEGQWLQKEFVSLRSSPVL